MGLRTTVVGSWWPQPDQQERLKRYHAGDLVAAEADDVLAKCASRAIVEQRELGLTEWTGGEYFTDEFLNQMQKVLTGIEIVRESRPEIFDYDDMAEARISGAIDAPGGMGYAAAFTRENALPGGVIKGTVVGPLEMAFNVMGEFEALKRQLPDLIGVVNREIKALANAGCRSIQLDVPTAATLITNGMMTPDEIADIIAGCFYGVDGVRRGIHICSGNLRGRPLSGNLTAAPWAQVLARLDGVVDVAHLALHYFQRYLERDSFAFLPRSIELAAGIVDEGCYAVEPVWKIRERAEAWARVVGEDRLWLAPSCGFGRHAERDIPLLREKMTNMVEAAASF